MKEINKIEWDKTGEFVVFKDKKFYPPYKCLCCGIVISKEQFCFGRCCGYCDLGRCNRGVGKNCLKYEEGHGRKDILENAEDMGDELQELVKEKIKIGRKENEILNPNCSEYVCRIGIKKFELPYIKKRLMDLGYKDDELLDEFTDYIDKNDDIGCGELMSESYAGDYEKIKDEILSKRNNKRICPFCKEIVEELKLHIKKYHKEEAIFTYDELDEDDINMMRKEIILDNLN